ncbi:MAG: PepSY-associated TM helix domain-containing protein [Steroidobacteraceae bacterium]
MAYLSKHLMAGFLDNPHASRLRRALFQVHLWVGVIAGLYLLVVCLTGALLVFRIDLQRAANPELFVSRGDRPLASPALVLQELRIAYPNGRIAGIDAPTTSRPSYLAYVVEDRNFRTVLIDPVSAKVLGELPKTWINILQSLHFNLLLGRTGTLVNGIGALCLLTLCLTGLVIWWQGRRNWWRGFTIRQGSWPQINWDLHRAAGIWAFIAILIWALTALSFTFPRQFRSVVQAFSSISVSVAPKSNGANADRIEAIPSMDELLNRASALAPGQYMARVVLPAKPDDSMQILFARQQPTPAGSSDFTTIYLDRYTGKQLAAAANAGASAGDLIMQWKAPLHVGSFGGLGIKLLWAMLGFAPALLFVTGLIAWWRRVVRPAYAASAARVIRGAG